MKIQERDELLARLDERTANIWKVTEAQEEHLKEINGRLIEHAKAITENTTLQPRVTNLESRQWTISKKLWILIGILTTLGGGIGGYIVQLFN